MWRTVVRLDETRSSEFSDSRVWNMSSLQMNTLVFENGNEGDRILAKSFSGNERNRLFLRDGDNFEDVSLVSGADAKEDGRGFAAVDFDDDGWLDIVVTSPNSPRLQILKNNIGKGANSDQRNSLSIELIGGASGVNDCFGWSPRDAIGAVVKVNVDGVVRAFQASCGEGLSSQNSRRIHVGLGSSEDVDSISVQWPSGRTSEVIDVELGSRAIIKERE